MPESSTRAEALAPPHGPNRAARRHPERAAQRHPERGYVGLQDAAAYLDVNPMTIRRMISRGQLAAYRLGNRLIKIRVADLDALMSPIGAA